MQQCVDAKRSSREVVIKISIDQLPICLYYPTFSNGRFALCYSICIIDLIASFMIPMFFDKCPSPSPLLEDCADLPIPILGVFTHANTLL